MQSIVIKQTMQVLQDAPTVIAAGRLPSGELLRFCTLGPGVEAQIETPGGQVKHRCFESVYAFMLWFVENYVETGRV